MKYTTINELNHFSFHDATIKAMTWFGKDLKWELYAVNATTDNTQNDFEKDMCIESAEVIFTDALIESIVFGGYKTYGSGGILIEEVEAKTALAEEHDNILRDSLTNYCYILSMDNYKQAEDGRYLADFNIDGGLGMLLATLTFSGVTLSWEEFGGEAWYEHPKWKKSSSKPPRDTFTLQKRTSRFSSARGTSLPKRRTFRSPASSRQKKG